MLRVAQFEKVSFEEYLRAFIDVYPKCNSEEDIKCIKEYYDAIELPTRATSGSAGYDFRLPMAIILEPDQSMIIPTGIRAYIEEGWMLAVFPRSGLGFKYRVQLDNTVGIIDSDYYSSKNEGHIIIKITNDSKNSDNTLRLDDHDKFVQGVFIPYGITVDDKADGLRDGGFGSTDGK